MIGKNIRYYRLLKKMSQEALAQSVGIGKMAVSNYESGKRTPDYNTSRKLANALGISLSMLLAQASTDVSIQHGAFRKHSALTKSQQEVVLGGADRYLEKLYEAVSFVGDSALPEVPVYNRIQADDYEQAGQYLRHILELAANGPVGNITDILENRGFIVCPIDLDERGFSGNSGTVNGRPYIAINVTAMWEACSILGRSRQNIDDLMRRGKLHPITIRCSRTSHPGEPHLSQYCCICSSEGQMW